MGGNRRLRESTLMLAALLLLGALQALSGNGAAWGGVPGRPDAAVAAGNAAVVVTGPATLDTRLLSEGRPEPGPRASRHDGLSAAGSPDPRSGPSGRRAAASIERAAHPERRSGIRLRGPPGLPV